MYWLTEKFLKLTINTAHADSVGSNPITISLPNPLGEGATIETLLVRIIDFVVAISIPILTIVFIYAAFIMLTAGGKEDKYTQGRKILLYAVIGFAIILAGEGIVKLIEAIVVGEASP